MFAHTALRLARRPRHIAHSTRLPSSISRKNSSLPTGTATASTPIDDAPPPPSEGAVKTKRARVPRTIPDELKKEFENYNLVVKLRRTPEDMANGVLSLSEGRETLERLKKASFRAIGMEGFSRLPTEEEWEGFRRHGIVVSTERRTRSDVDSGVLTVAQGLTALRQRNLEAAKRGEIEVECELFFWHFCAMKILTRAN